MPVCKTCNKTFEGVYRKKFCSTACQFEPKLRRCEDSGCIEWTGSIGGPGYGIIRVDGEPKSTHRLSYELHHGPIPSHLHVLHKCDNRKCVNIEHLFLGTQRDNMIDMASKGRAAFQGGTRSAEDIEKIIKGRVSPRVASAKQKEVAAKTMKALWEKPEFRAKHSVAPNKGKKMDEETRQKFSQYWESLKGRKTRPHSEATKQKMREAALKRKDKQRDT